MVSRNKTALLHAVLFMRFNCAYPILSKNPKARPAFLVQYKYENYP